MSQHFGAIQIREQDLPLLLRGIAWVRFSLVFHLPTLPSFLSFFNLSIRLKQVLRLDQAKSQALRSCFNHMLELKNGSRQRKFAKCKLLEKLIRVIPRRRNAKSCSLISIALKCWHTPENGCGGI